MTSGFKEKAIVVGQEKIASDVYSMWIQTDDIAKNSKAGQFVTVFSKDGSRLLPRPISICEIDGSKIRIVYRVVGKGTDEFSTFESDEVIDVQGPLGNGYPLFDKKAILLGGGVGIPPLLELAKQLNCEKNIVLGYRDELFLNGEFAEYGKVTIATEDGSIGTKGNVLDAMKEHNITGDVIYACGPKPMLSAIKAYAEENNIEAYLSMEEKMACGVGACLGCVCKSAEIDDHSRVYNKRVCKEGPVFNSKEVEL